RLVSVSVGMTAAGGISGCTDDKQSSPATGSDVPNGSDVPDASDVPDDSDKPDASHKPDTDQPSEPGTPVVVDVASEALTLINQQLDEVQELDADGLVAKYPVEFSSELSFDPLDALNFDLIQESSLALSEQQ